MGSISSSYSYSGKNTRKSTDIPSHKSYEEIDTYENKSYGSKSDSHYEKDSTSNKMEEVFRKFQKVDECKKRVNETYSEYNKANKQLDKAKKELFEAVDKLDTSTKDTLRNLLDGVENDRDDVAR